MILPLTQGQCAIIDEEDLDRLSPFCWRAKRHIFYANHEGREPRFYAAAHMYKDNRRTTVNMHRFIMKTPEGLVTDHINGNTLDNRKANLRIATKSQNAANMVSRSLTGYKGVVRVSDISFTASIKVNGTRIALGTFYDVGEAAQAYNEAARSHFGEFAKLNKIAA